MYSELIYDKFTITSYIYNSYFKTITIFNYEKIVINECWFKQTK